MSGGPLPLLWLYGPSGVGKSTVGWEIFSQLSRAGIKAGYLDTDQLGLCYPSVADLDNDQVKARNLGAVWPTYRAAGARCLAVSGGGLETRQMVRTCADLASGTALTLCRLRAGHDELRKRIAHRGWLTHLADEAVDEADALDSSDFADLCIDTDGLSVPDVARLVREQAGGWPCLTE